MTILWRQRSALSAASSSRRPPAPPERDELRHDEEVEEGLEGGELQRGDREGEGEPRDGCEGRRRAVGVARLVLLAEEAEERRDIRRAGHLLQQAQVGATLEDVARLLRDAAHARRLERHERDVEEAVVPRGAEEDAREESEARRRVREGERAHVHCITLSVA